MGGIHSGNKCVIILGMHRSGTSALSGALFRAGFCLGQDVMKPQEDNPQGFFENERIVAIHDELLSELGSSWHDVRPLRVDWRGEECVVRAKQALMEVFREEAANQPITLVKDPRVTRFWPLWSEVFSELAVEPIPLLAIRNPEAVAKSLERRNEFSRKKSLYLWLQHAICGWEAVSASSGNCTAFEDFTRDPRSVLERLDLGLTEQQIERGAEGVIARKADDFHQEASDGKLGEICSGLYSAVVAATDDVRSSEPYLEALKVLEEIEEIIPTDLSGHSEENLRKELEALSGSKLSYEDDKNPYKLALEESERKRAELRDGADQCRNALEASEKKRAELEDGAEQYRDALEGSEKKRAELEDGAEQYRNALEASEKKRAELEDGAEQYRNALEASEKKRAELEDGAEQYRNALEASEKKCAELEDGYRQLKEVFEEKLRRIDELEDHLSQYKAKVAELLEEIDLVRRQ